MDRKKLILEALRTYWLIGDDLKDVVDKAKIGCIKKALKVSLELRKKTVNDAKLINTLILKLVIGIDDTEDYLKTLPIRNSLASEIHKTKVTNTLRKARINLKNLEATKEILDITQKLYEIKIRRFRTELLVAENKLN